MFGTGTGGSTAQAGDLCNVGSFAFHSAATAHAAIDALYAAIVAEGYAARPDDIFDPAHAPPSQLLDLLDAIRGQFDTWYYFLGSADLRQRRPWRLWSQF